MALASTNKDLSERGLRVERHWRELAGRRRLYTLGALGLFLFAFVGALMFANDANSGKFLDRLPHLFDFIGDLAPHDPVDILRALFDLPSPHDDGSLKYNYPEGRIALTGSLYLPEYFYKMLETLNIAIVATLIGAAGGFCLAFLAARNMMPNAYVRGTARRILELFRAFPEVVIAGFFLAIFSLGAIPAIIAVSIHTIGALGKMFYEVIENADMRPVEGLTATGGNWFERVRFGIVPDVAPNFLSYALLRFEINVRASTIIGAVGGGGIGELLRLSISQNHGAKTFAIMGLIFVTVIVVDQISARLRSRMSGDNAIVAKGH